MSVAPRARSLLCASPRGLHRLAYREWGDPHNRRVLVCVHGLTRCARDFDALAGALCDRYRVVCPDLAGRGDSDWLPEASLYGLAQYVGDLVTLIARLDAADVHWVGTSLGGLIGMALGAQKNTPVARLVLNDVGPVVTHASLARIASYVGLAPAFADLGAAQAYAREVWAGFGPHSDAEWRFLTEIALRANADGGYRLHYDPAIGEAYRATLPEKDLVLWPVYDALRCPTLVLRGEHSDLLTRETCAQMRERGPRARIVEIGGTGHAPSLLHADQIEIVRAFLLAG